MVFFIYIPLCLYFNPASVIIVISSCHIYIPLCLYFNADELYTKNIVKEFTFHYVSILMEIGIYDYWFD